MIYVFKLLSVAEFKKSEPLLKSLGVSITTETRGEKLLVKYAIPEGLHLGGVQ